MENTKKLNPQAVIALKEALISIYWYKKDLRLFLKQSLSYSDISNIDWDSLTKRDVVSMIVDNLIEKNKTYVLLELCHNVCNMASFEHLARLDDGANKVRNAKRAVSQLQDFVKLSSKISDDKKLRNEKIKKSKEKKEKFANYQMELNILKNDYMELIKISNYQQRGYKLEKIMNRLFLLNDLDPKSSFKLKGEQIDGAFSLEGTEFLLEAKWVSEPVNKAELAIFKEKVKGKLENTLGLFISINGFSSEGVEAFESQDKVIILMDGFDLMCVLEDRIKISELILRKKQIASREGKIYVPYNKMLEQ